MQSFLNVIVVEEIKGGIKVLEKHLSPFVVPFLRLFWNILVYNGNLQEMRNFTLSFEKLQNILYFKYNYETKLTITQRRNIQGHVPFPSWFCNVLI